MSVDEHSSSISSLVTIVRGASIFAVGKILYNAFEFLLNIYLTRSLGVDLYGIYAYASTILSASVVLTNAGSDKSVQKYLPQYADQPRIRQFMLGMAFVTSLIGGMMVAGLLILFAPTISRYTLESSLFVDTVRIFALIVLTDTVTKVTMSTFRAIELVEYEVFVNRIVSPLLRLGLVGITLSLGYTFLSAMAALLVASLLTLGLAFYLFMSRLEVRPVLREETATKDRVTSYYNFTVPLTLQGSASVLRSRIDILMIGYFLTASAVGVYNVAVLVSALLLLPISAINRLFPTMASKLYSNGEMERLSEIYGILTRWIFTLTLFLAIGAVIYRTEILAIFGDEFTAGAVVLSLFVAGQLANACAGPSGMLLMMTDHQYAILANQWVFGALNVFLNYVLIIEVGVIGAALASAFTLAALNATRIVEVWHFEGFFPYSLSFLKPMAAAIPAVVSMYAVGEAVAGLPGLFVGGVVGIVLYASTLVALGVDEKDREFFSNALS